MTQPIGIDMGTTRSVVATLEGGRPRVIPNAEGQLATPSVVAFTPEGKVLVGQAARRQAAENPRRTVASVKRHMGSSWRFRMGGQEYRPQEISAFILSKLKADVEAYLGEQVGQAVIGVPAYFNDRQRQATKEAATLAGLEVLRLINEPTAAALAYGLEREEPHTVLVWDLGGGTFDVSILELGEGVFEVKAVSGDNWLGGDDFDQRLVDWLTQEYQRVGGQDLSQDDGVRVRLREAAAQAKIQLSLLPEVTVRFPLLGTAPEPPHLVTTLTREKLEALVADLLHRLLPPVRQVLSDARLTPKEIDRVILVGNGTRMPAVRRLAAQILEQEPYRAIDPEAVTALGIAIEAGMLLGLVDKAVLLDVLPLSLGIETQGGLMAPLIPRNTPLPASEARVFTTAADYQTAMDIHVLQGERALAADNVSLGRFQLQDIPTAPRGVLKVEVAFEADVDGIVHVSATELLSGNEVKAKVASSKTLDRDEMDRLGQEAQTYAGMDGEQRGRVQAGIEAQNLIAAAEPLLNQEEGVVRGQAARLPAHVPRQVVAGALAHLKEALAAGEVEEIRARSKALRRLVSPAGDREAKAAPVESGA
jgi:molecular chaperone DnaK